MLSAYTTISFYGNRRQPAQFRKGRRMFSPFYTFIQRIHADVG
jgi:hypothetical protein